VSLVALFDESLVPMGYKIRVNDYISAIRPETRGAEKGGEHSDSRAVPIKAAAATPAAKPVQNPPKAALKNDDWPSPDEAANTSAPVAKLVTETAAPAAHTQAKPAAAAKPATDDFDLDLPS
jgi:hypothetical protein